ncbi:MAG: DUF427 domain-containing protein [Nannocystis sp.]|nr:DUF427 domain-containing protein [Nannocystis sp.]MBA3549421.1 DUF427 domain-containing protein [Nannocystis sp.]
MATASWNGVTIAESGEYEVVEGNVYFPRSALREQYFAPSATTTVCGWKGTASYFDVVVDGQTNQGAAWYYADPKPAAANIRGHVAFWRGVTVTR